MAPSSQESEPPEIPARFSDHDARRPALPLHQLAQQPLGCALITPALDQYVEHDAVLVDRAPEPMLYPGDFDDDFIEMPFVSGTGQPAPNLVGEVLAELERPLRTLSWLTIM